MVKKAKDIALLSLIAIPLGAIIGVITSYFGQVLLAITDFRYNHAKYLIPFLAIGGLISMLMYEKLGGNAKQGMKLILDTNKDKKIPLRLIPLIIGGTWLTHLFGGSAGREGVAVQIGGALAHNIGKKTKINDASDILLIAGMAGGFAGLFQTPITAIIFALEISRPGKQKHLAIPPAIISAFISCKMSSILGLEKFFVSIDAGFDIKLVPKIILAGAIFGLVGGGFAFLLGKAKSLAKKISNPYIRVASISIVLSIALLLLHSGRYAGLGTNLISASFENGNIFAYDFALKFLLTIATLSAGYQGGEVTPLFSIGASLGTVLAGLIGVPAPLLASIGYATVFGSATGTLIAPMLIGVEVFGIQTLPYMIIASAIAKLCSFKQSIYD